MLVYVYFLFRNSYRFLFQICHACLHPDKPNLDPHSDAYMKQAQELVNNELVLLQTLGNVCLYTAIEPEVIGV